MHSKTLSLLLLIALLVLTACAPQVAPAGAPASDKEQPGAQPAQTDASPSPQTAAATPRTLTVLAAASLSESFTEIGRMFEARNAGVTVTFNYAGSQQLAQQLDQGAGADVFASASRKYMEAAVSSKRVAQYDAKTFVTNRLVVIFPKDNPAKIKELKDLAKPGLKLDLADQSVPVGQYTLEFLDKAAKDEAFGAAFKDDVLKNVVSYEDNVKAIVTKVSLGEADAGIVYVTDITTDIAAKLDRMDIPDAFNTIATYPIAAITDSKAPDLAKAFVELVLSPDGQAVMAKYGFIPAVTGASSTEGFMVTDALGRAIRFEKAPERIVLAGKALIMVADAIYLFPEAGKRIVALGSTKQGSGNFIPIIDPTYSGKISLDSNAGVEQIAAAQPDCVIMKSSNASTLGKALEAAKMPVVYLDFETPEQYQRDLKTLGQLFQNPDQAARLSAYYKDKADAVIKTVASLEEEQKPRALVLYYNEKDNTVAFNVPPMGWMQTLLVTMAGGRPVWQDANPGNGWSKVSLEQIAAWNPDVIFVIAYFNPVNEVTAALKADSKWQALDAVKNDKIYAFATDVYSWDQPDTRWILGLAWVAGKLHPDLFSGQDIVKEAQAFYRDLYGMGDTVFQNEIVPLLSGDIH